MGGGGRVHLAVASGYLLRDGASCHSGSGVYPNTFVWNLPQPDPAPEAAVACGLLQMGKRSTFENVLMRPKEV